MTTLLIRHASLVVTMDDHRREIPDGGLFIRDGFMEQVGPSAGLPDSADEILDLHDHILLPGLDQHPPPFLPDADPRRAGRPECQPVQLAEDLYPIWAGMTPEDIYISTQTALAELALSGCTTASDHLYIFPEWSPAG